MVGGEYRNGEEFESLLGEEESVWMLTVHCSPYPQDDVVHLSKSSAIHSLCQPRQVSAPCLPFKGGGLDNIPGTPPSLKNHETLSDQADTVLMSLSLHLNSFQDWRPSVSPTELTFFLFTLVK